jgi:hypothetical protein
MKKDEFIEKRGEEAWARHLVQSRKWRQKNPDKLRKSKRKWRSDNPEKARDAIKRWSLAHPGKVRELNRKWGNANLEKVQKRASKWRQEHPENILEWRRKQAKGGKFYLKRLEDQKTGLRGERNKLRHIHGRRWRLYKKIIAPESQIHHEWIPGSAEYHGIALVEKNAHQYGTVDVIKILDGKITVFTEKEIQEREHHGN